MGGRFHNRGGRGPGRGFPHRGNRQGRGHQSNRSDKQKQPERKFLFHPNSAQNIRYYTFPEILKSMVSKMRASDQWGEAPLVADSIEALKSTPPESPKEPTGIKQEVDGKETVIYDELEMTTWKSEMVQYMKDKDKFDKVYQQSAAYIYEKYCTQSMQQRLSDLPVFDTQLKKDPVALLLKIRTVVSDGAATVHPLLSDVHLTQRTYSPKQEYSHSTESYIKMVQSNTDQFFETMGWTSVDSMARKRADYQALSKEHQDEALVTAQHSYIMRYRRQYVAILAITGLQEGRYGTFQSDIAKAYAFDGTDIYPDSLDHLREILTSGRFAPTKEWHEKKKDKGPSKPPAKRPPFNPNKKIENMPAAMFYQQKAKEEACYCCGAPDHKSFTCPKKNEIPKDKWVINQFTGMKKSFFQQYHQFQQSQANNTQGTQATQASQPASIPPSPVFVQPAIAPDVQSHRSGFSPMTFSPALQQTFQ